MAQHGQVVRLRTRRADGKAMWAYRYRVDGRCSRRPQVGGFATRTEAERALRRELERLRPGVTLTLGELVDEYLRIHQAAPSTLEKLRWLLAQGDGDVRRCRAGRAPRGRDLRVARHAAGGASLRSNPGAATSAQCRGGLGAD